MQMDGTITQWKPSTGHGQISSNEGTFSFDAANSPGLAEQLSDTIIPPDPPVAVTFDLAGTGEAINVVVTQSVTMAASAEPMAARGLRAKNTALKQAPKKNAVQSSPEPTKKRPAGKKVATTKSRNQSRKPGSKKRRP